MADTPHRAPSDSSKGAGLPSLPAIALYGVLTTALLLGGSSRAGLASNLVVEIVAAVGLAVALTSSDDAPLAGFARTVLWLALAWPALALVQLVPMPFALWSAMPGHGVIAQGLTDAGVAASARPLSLAPERTILFLLGVLPALSTFGLTLLLSRSTVDRAVRVFLSLAVLSALIAVAQVSGGQTSPLYFYAVTNPGDGVGMLANANHQATLMVAALPFVGALTAQRLGRKARRPQRYLPVALGGGIIAALLVAIALSGSVAGVGLGSIALIAATLFVLEGSGASRRTIGWVAGGSLVVLTAGVAFGVLNWRAIGFGSESEIGLGRVYMWDVTAHAAASFFPFGSGLGSFEPVFHLFEDRHVVTSVFANHAHNDVLETALTGGALGLLLITIMLIWLGWAGVALWRERARRDFTARAAWLSAVLMLAHSLVDYPLRTEALASVFGFCLAITARAVSRRIEPVAAQGRHLSA